MIRPLNVAWRLAFRGPAPAPPTAWIAALLLGLGACRENLSAPPLVGGPDTTGPVLQLSPAHDTLADSVGILLVHLTAHDASGIKSVDLLLLPATSSFSTLTPLDTVVDTFYPVPLGGSKHSSLRFYARSRDVLDHETVTDTVTVTVR